jgi:hypothetical protein
MGSWNIGGMYINELRKRGLSVAKGEFHIVFLKMPQMLGDDHTNALYNACDLGINTCNGAVFELTTFEHLGIGVPQVASTIGGFLDYLDDDRALMVKPKLSIYNDSTRGPLGGEQQFIDIF